MLGEGQQKEGGTYKQLTGPYMRVDPQQLLGEDLLKKVLWVLGSRSGSSLTW